MALKARICCCGASRWTQVISWIYIIWHTIQLFRVGVELAAFNDSDMKQNIVFTVVFSILRIVMAIILLIGTIEECVDNLIAWIIYEGLIGAMGGVLVLLHIYEFIELEYSCIRFVVYNLVIAFNGFSFFVVCTNMMEMKEGLYDLHPKLPVAVSYL